MKVISVTKGHGSQAKISEVAQHVHHMRGGSYIVDRRLTKECRYDPILNEVVQELGQYACDGEHRFEVVEVPDEYDVHIVSPTNRETARKILREEHLRNLIRNGNENDIVNYVMGAFKN